MALNPRRRLPFQWPITLSVLLMLLNIALMVGWIVLLARLNSWSGLTIGTILFVLILVGLSLYMAFTIKEVRLRQRQANFVDSVTHELKTPISSLRLYLETLQMRSLSEERQQEFFEIMGSELQRLDQLINQLLEVGRLDAIGQQTEPEDVDLGPLLERSARIAATHHQVDVDAVYIWKVEPVVIHARRLVLELIFGNVLDNAIKYGGDPPRVEVTVRKHHGHVITTIQDNGEGVPQEIRKKIFQLFFRGGSELERRQKGTGLGLYIARTLVRMLKGSITVRDRAEGAGSVFEIDLPDGRHGKNSDR